MVPGFLLLEIQHPSQMGGNGSMPNAGFCFKSLSLIKNNFIHAWTLLGCSTGQEAYSIAMAFTESAEKAYSRKWSPTSVVAKTFLRRELSLSPQKFFLRLDLLVC
jgi:hypothetical protein